MQDLVDEETQKVFSWSTPHVPQSSTSTVPPTPIDGVITECSGKDTAFLSIEVPSPPRNQAKKMETLMLVIVDRSGSMKTFWKPQVIPALHSLAQIVWANQNTITAEVISYSTTASVITLGPDQPSFTHSVNSLVAAGGTHFSKAFEAIKERLTGLLKSHKRKPGYELNIAIIFMTDGQDSQGDAPSGKPHWDRQLGELKTFLRSDPLCKGIESVFHALAFSASHDFKFLEMLRADAGTIQGGFQYVEPGDGANALQTKLDAIVSSISHPAIQSTVSISAPGYLINTGSCLKESFGSGLVTLSRTLIFSQAQPKIVLNLVVKKDGSSTTPNSPSADETTKATSTIESPPTEQSKPKTEYVPITDYYGNSLPVFHFPQPGQSFQFTSNPSYDPYATCFDFGPQPGMSHMNHSYFDPASIEEGHSSTYSSSFMDTTAQHPEQVIYESATPPTVISETSPSSSASTSSSVNNPLIGNILEIQIIQETVDNPGVKVPTALKVRIDLIDKESDIFVVELEKTKNIMELIEQEISILSLKAANVPASTWNSYSEYLHKMEKSFGSTMAFSLSLPRSKRNQITELTASMREIFARMHASLATATAGNLSTAQLARMAELAHGQQFQKARRSRLMDARSHQNAAGLSLEESELAKLVIDVGGIDSTMDRLGFDESDKLLREWFCVLTQDNWYNLIANEKDCIGFGIAVRRPEFVVDDPTQIRILDISLTCVSKSSFEHVLSYKLMQSTKDATDPIQARLAYLGGFNVEGKDLGVVVRGSANEPINAWLPLYIHPEHWKIALTQLKSITGYLVTLNPLGYAFGQLDVYFMILATMVVRMKVVSNRQVELTLQFLRTCTAIMSDIQGMKKKMIETVFQFFSNPAQRLRDVLPNLMVLLGYMLVLSPSDIAGTLKSPGDWAQMWMVLFGEITRRAMDSCSKFGQLGNSAAILLQNLVSRLVDGYAEETPLTHEELVKVFSPEASLQPPPNPYPNRNRTFQNFSCGPSATDDQLEHKQRLQNVPKLELLPTTGENHQAQSLWSAFWEAAERDVHESRHHMEWESLRATDDTRVMAPMLKTKPQLTDNPKATEGRSFVTSCAAAQARLLNTNMIHDISPYYGNSIVIDTTDSSSSSQDKMNQAKANRESRIDASVVKNREFVPEAVLPKSLEAIELCENVVKNFGTPTIEGLINIMTFMKSWNTLIEINGGHNSALKALDNNLGVAPISWIMHFRDDWQHRPHVRNSFFTFLNFVDPYQIPDFRDNHTHLGPEVLQFQMLRAILAQNARYSINKDAREAISSGTWINPLSHSQKILVKLNKERIDRLITEASARAAAIATNAAINVLKATNDIYEFIGYLLSERDGFGGRRHTCFAAYSPFWQTLAPCYPLAYLKLSIVISGKFIDPYTGTVVQVISGPEWIPGRSCLAKLHRVWGYEFKKVMELVHLTYAKPERP